MSVSLDPLLCTEGIPALALGTGVLFVDMDPVGNVVIVDPAGEGENIASFIPHSQDASDRGQAQIGFQRRVIIEATCDDVTLSNLELLLKEQSAPTASGFRIPYTTVRDETLHHVEFVHDLGECGGDCTELVITLRRAFIELPWSLPFRRDAFTEFVLRFVSLPDADFPASPYGYMDLTCAGGGS
jgi:hypothetical protein